VKSINRLPLPPPDIGLPIVNIEIATGKLFGHHPRLKSNLTSSQKGLFGKLRRDLNIGFAAADKNLGPVAVTLKQYINDSLLHLQYESTYAIILQEEAFLRYTDI
jgi:hypothetical protein